MPTANEERTLEGVTYGKRTWQTLYSLAAFNNQPKTRETLYEMRAGCHPKAISSALEATMRSHPEYIEITHSKVGDPRVRLYALSEQGMSVIRRLSQFSEPSRGDEGI